MNKNDLMDAVAQKANITKKEAAEALNAIIDAIVTELQGGGEVQLVGFGTFSVSERAAREGRNPATGMKMSIPASKYPKFTAGKGFKDKVNS